MKRIATASFAGFFVVLFLVYFFYVRIHHMNEPQLLTIELIEEAMRMAIFSEVSQLHTAISTNSIEAALQILYSTNYDLESIQ